MFILKSRTQLRKAIERAREMLRTREFEPHTEHFPLGPALTQRFEATLVALRDRYGEVLWEQVVARVTGGDLDLVGLGTEADDVADEDDFGLHGY